MARLESLSSIGISAIDHISRRRWILPLFFIVTYAITYSIFFPKVFLSKYNITAVMLEFSIPAIIVIGMTILLISGEIDLSVGFNVMFSNMFIGTLIVIGFPIYLSIIITLMLSCFFGMIVGVLVARLRVNSFIATLGMGLVYYGLTQFLFSAMYSVTNDGIDIRHLPDAFTTIGNHVLFGFQLPVFFSVLLITVFTYLMSKSRYFRKYYYIGMNEEAARLTGIKTYSMKIIAFSLSGLLACFSGILLAARMGASAATNGKGWELKIIMACVIGGVSMQGGKGTMGGAILGILFATCLSNGLRIAYAPSVFYSIIEGFILLSAVIVDAQFSSRNVI